MVIQDKTGTADDTHVFMHCMHLKANRTLRRHFFRVACRNSCLALDSAVIRHVDHCSGLHLPKYSTMSCGKSLWCIFLCRLWMYKMRKSSCWAELRCAPAAVPAFNSNFFICASFAPLFV